MRFHFFVLVALLMSSNVNAALSNSAVLIFDPGSAFDLGGTGAVPFATHDGIVIGTSQLAGNSHPGLPDGSELPGIDQPWAFLGNTGMQQTSSPVNILSDDGVGNVTLDFSGWEIIWNGLLSPISLGSGAFGSNPDGVAILTCGLDCSTGDTFSLYYTATIPLTDPSNLGGATFQLGTNGATLKATGTTGVPVTGVIGTSVVPVPPAIWLFGSGLLWMAGYARRHKY